MEVFALTVDTLVKVWRREEIEVEANSLEEAVEKIANGCYDDSVDCIDCEYLYETEEGIRPEDNNNKATLEIMDGNEIVYSNEDNR